MATPKSNRDTRNQTYNSTESSSSLIPTESDDLILKNDAKLCRYLQLQIWIGGLLGLLVCLIIAIILGIFYIIGNDLWTVAEHY